MAESEFSNLSVQYILYTRAECPLCDDAAELLDAAALEYRECDIDDSIELLTRYRARIPVFFDPSSSRELGWPFDPEALKEFVDEA